MMGRDDGEPTGRASNRVFSSLPGYKARFCFRSLAPTSKTSLKTRSRRLSVCGNLDWEAGFEGNSALGRSSWHNCEKLGRGAHGIHPDGLGVGRNGLVARQLHHIHHVSVVRGRAEILSWLRFGIDHL